MKFNPDMILFLVPSRVSLRRQVMRLRIRPELSIVVAGWLLAQGQTEPPALEPGKKLQCDLDAGPSQDHYVLLRTGEYARLDIAQHTVNVAVAVFDPAGKQLFALDTNSIGDAEDVELIAAASGKYRLRVVAPEAHAPSGRYEIALAAVSLATERHEARIAAAREVALATAENRRSTREAMLQAIRHFDAARLHWHAAEDPGEQARALYTTAFIYIELGDRQKALSKAAEALPLARAARNDQLLGRVLDCIGEVHNNFSDKKAAIDHYMQALPLLRASGDRAGEAKTLSNLG